MSEEEEEDEWEEEDGLGDLVGGRSGEEEAPEADAASSIFRMDITNKATDLLQDAWEGISFTVLNNKHKVVYVSAEEIKGVASAEYDSITTICTVEFYYKLKVKFEVHYEGVAHRGRISLAQINKDKLSAIDFPFDILWLNGIAPKGYVFNQVMSLLCSPKARNTIRRIFDDFQTRCVAFLQPKLQGFDRDALKRRAVRKMNRCVCWSLNLSG